MTMNLKNVAQLKSKDKYNAVILYNSIYYSSVSLPKILGWKKSELEHEETQIKLQSIRKQITNTSQLILIVRSNQTWQKGEISTSWDLRLSQI